MKRTLVLVLLAAVAVLPAAAQWPGVTLPPDGDNQRSTVTQQIGLVKVTLDYSSPDVHAPDGSLAKKYVRYGSSPRGAQALILAAKIFALLDGRFHVAKADIAKAAPASLRHRVILNFEGEAEGKTSDDVIAEILRT